jgi:hypothetical protein
MWAPGLNVWRPHAPTAKSGPHIGKAAGAVV